MEDVTRSSISKRKSLRGNASAKACKAWASSRSPAKPWQPRNLSAQAPNPYRGRAHPRWRRLPPTMHTVPRIAWPSPIAFNVLVGIRLGEQKGATASQTIALGRKNLLFAGSETAGQCAANIISLIQATKANGHEPHAYLRDVLTRLPTQLNSRIGELLPRAWQSTSA